jgi:hypothetical protein
MMRTELFPWADVDAARDDTRLQGGRDAEKARTHYGSEARCPKCSRPGDELAWVYFRSPAWTWQSLCGREGWLAVCDDCRAQAAFFLTFMS